MTLASYFAPLAMLYFSSTSCLVISIICRPYAVTLDEMARQGSFPTVAPVKPYTELALICRVGGIEGAERQRSSQIDFMFRERGSHLEGELTTVQHGSFERVFLNLEIRLGLLSCRQQVLENDCEQSLAPLGRHKVV